MYPEKPKNTALKIASGIIVIIAVVLVTIASTVSANQKKQAVMVPVNPVATTSTTATPTPTILTATATPTTAATAPPPASPYKDGTYTSMNQYYVPHGYESIKVTLTVKSGIITDSTIFNSENNRESQIFQEDFVSVYKSYVVGKNIDGLNLSVVAGASDTTSGFNNAVTAIQDQARA